MKVSFVGKGGSGKSTVSSSFIRYLLTEKKKVLAIDADINMHLGKMCGIEPDEKKRISEYDNPQKIREYLRGSNNRIENVDKFVKSTPPANGSNFMTLQKDNYIIKNFTQNFSDNGYFMQVGSYSEDRIGGGCYHTNLSVLENILTHTILGKDEWIVCDMVAGTDAFAGPMHFQFDVVFLVVEPTIEGVGVFEQYKTLSQKAGVFDDVFVIGNKIEDEADQNYLEKQIGEKLIGSITINKEFKKQRREGHTSLLDRQEDKQLFQKVYAHLASKKPNDKRMLDLLYKLHEKHSQEDWVVGTYGLGLEKQIDTSFDPNQLRNR